MKPLRKETAKEVRKARTNPVEQPHHTVEEKEARKARAKIKEENKKEAGAKSATTAVVIGHNPRGPTAATRLHDAEAHLHRVKRTFACATGFRKANAKTETNVTSGIHLSVTSSKDQAVAKMATIAITYIRKSTKGQQRRAHQLATAHRLRGVERLPQRHHQKGMDRNRKTLKKRPRLRPREKQKQKGKPKAALPSQPQVPPW